MTDTCIELQLFPCIGYLSILAKAGTIMLEAHENYQKQTLRNRFKINTANNVQALTVPVEGKKSIRKSITETKISYYNNWPTQHLRTIKSAYAKAPFFDYFFPDIQKLWLSEPEYLYNFNLTVLKNIISWFELEIKIQETQSYKPLKHYKNDLRNVTSKGDFSNFYKLYPYLQVFDNNFRQNLSCMDLLFCVGPREGRKMIIL